MGDDALAGGGVAVLSIAESSWACEQLSPHALTVQTCRANFTRIARVASDAVLSGLGGACPLVACV